VGRIVRRVLAVLVGMLSPALSSAQEKSDTGDVIGLSAQFRSEVRPILLARCAKCHGGEKKKGGIDFSALADGAGLLEQRKLWKKTFDQVDVLAMPPQKEPTLEAKERERLLAWTRAATSWVDPARASRRDPGPAPLRRLSRTEYALTIRDLTGLDFDASQAVGMPEEEPGAQALESRAEGLTVSLVHLEKYFLAADQVLDRLLAGRPGSKLTPKKASAEAYARVFFAVPGPDLSEEGAARKILSRFLRLAYRRPVSGEDLDPMVAVFRAARDRRELFEEAIRVALRAALVSPSFLYRLEGSRPAGGGRGPHPLTEHELATRLSYFLWSRMPDEALLSAADRGHLSEPAVFEAQIRRMLADPKAHALTQSFAIPWTRLKFFNRARPSTDHFPTFTRKLRDAMLQEATTFFDKLREDDRPVLDLLDSDYTYVNEELAKHYGIDGVKGDTFHRVDLKPEQHRGGLLGMAAVLAMGAETSRTSPTLRGKWVLEVLFGTPPPPPPANAGRLKEDGKKEKTPKTFREKIALHAKDPSCAACHSRIDPMGFGLEQYDAIGAWRETVGEAAVDCSGVLPSGEQFHGAAELKAVLRKKQGAFVRNLVEQMFSYALGRDLGDDDEAAVREAKAFLEKNECRFSALMIGVAESLPFRWRRGDDGGDESK
jgi:mono/diheme cytochrome c family protein